MIDAGAIEVNVGLKDPERCRRLSMSLFNTRTEAAAAALCAPASRRNARRLITLLYGLCPIAHLVAFDEARLAALGRTIAPERRQLRALSVALEGLVETTRVLTLEAGRITGQKPDPASLRTLGSLRAELAAIAEHLLALDPFESEDSPDKALRRRALLDAGESVLLGVSTLARKLVYGMKPAAFLTRIKTAQALTDWAEAARGELACAELFTELLTLPKTVSLSIDPLPGPVGCIASGFAEELLHRMLKEPGFATAPFLDGAPALTGAAVRLTGSEAVRELRSAMGLTPAVLLAARLVETASAFEQTSARVAYLKTLTIFSDAAVDASADPDDIRLGEHFPVVAAGWGEGKGTGLGLVDTARGLLAHAAVVDSAGFVVDLKITAPTEWQFSPNGAGQRLAMALAKALPKLVSGSSAIDRIERLVREVLFGLDACVPLRISVAKEAIARLAEPAVECPCCSRRD